MRGEAWGIVRSVTVAASLLADMIGHLRAQGVDSDAVCRRSGIDPMVALSSGRRLPERAMAAFWREAVAATGDADLGLHMAVVSNPGALDIVGYVMLSSHTAADALRRGARLMRLLNDGLAIELTKERDTTVCGVCMLGGRDSSLADEPRQVIETVLMGIVQQLRLLTSRAVVPRAVTMRHATPLTGAREHERLFGVRPHFGADTDSVTFHNADLDISLRSANAQLLSTFEAHADAALTALGARDTLAGRVLEEILAQLKGEAPTITLVARAMAMSPRQLQRGLASEGVTFQTLLDEARRELAVRHLAAPDATVAKVAWLVGFSEPSAFHRAFRRWTGHSPRALA